MVGIVIGASIDSVYAINYAKNMGIYTIAIDGNAEAPGLKVADRPVIVDIKNEQLVCKKLEGIKPRLSIPVPIGRYLTTTGYVNDYFNIKGIDSKAAELCTDKYLFHKQLNIQGLREINASLIKSKQDYYDKEFQFPAIIKPRFGSGSRGVALINSKQELYRHLDISKDLREDFVIEDVVSGIEYGIDGVVIGGKATIILVRKKIMTPPPARQCVGYFSVVPSQNNRMLLQNIEQFLQKVVDEIGLDNSIFHADLIVGTDTIFIIEISGRPSGHYLYDVFTPYVTGVNILGEYIRYILNKKGNFKSKKTKTAAIHYFNFENCIVDYIPPSYEIMNIPECNIVDYRCNIKAGDYLGSIDTGYSIMKRGYFIIEGSNKENLVYQINKILGSFKLRY